MSGTCSYSYREAESLVSSHEAIRSPTKHELLTVDVWDTLLRRRCHPDGVKLHVCRYLLLQWGDRLDPVCSDPWILLHLRQQAEKEIGDEMRARGFDDEYGHLDVYRRWLDLAGFEFGGQVPVVLEDLLLELDRVEISQEKHVSYVDPSIGRTLRQLSVKRTLFLSDFYLPATAIKELLRHHGIDEIVSEGLVSCDIGYNKRSGRLYSHLREYFGVSADAHLHIGDNPWSDIKAARQAGINVMHFQPDEEHRRRLAREADFHDRQKALRNAIDALSQQTLPANVERQDYYQLGRECSPLLLGFVLMAMERAVSDKIESLYFFTREGEFLLEIYRRLADGDVLGFPPPRAELLMVSRLATFAGSLREFSTAELMRLWNQYSVQSLQALFKSLAMDPVGLASSAERHGLDLASPIRYPWQDSRVKAFFDDDDVRGRIEHHLLAKREELRAYLASAGIDEGSGRIGIVDIGWRGTIQDNLAYALPNLKVSGCYLGLNRFLNVQPENVWKNAYGPNLNQSETLGVLLDYVAPIEMLCNSPNGSVVGHESTVHGMKAIRHVDEDENRVHMEYIRHFQAGVLDSVPYWADLLRTHAYSSAELRPMSMEIWNRIIQSPPPFLTEAFFRLNHNEVFGVGGFLDKRRMIGIGDVLLAFVSREKRVRLYGYLSSSGWAPGLARCPDVSWYLRMALRLLLLGHKYKQRLFNSAAARFLGQKP
jgi:FMN phosphatase YigB (HAD superfamily)